MNIVTIFHLHYLQPNIEGHRVRKFKSGSRFYFNHGNAIWNIDSLLKIQKEDEGPYENEEIGTIRAWEALKDIYMVNIPWYDQDAVHEKGKIKESALNIIKSLKWRYAWENRPNSMEKFIASDGSAIPINSDKNDNPYGKNWGCHFSEQDIILNNKI